VKLSVEYMQGFFQWGVLQLIKDLEKVQMRATKLVISIKNLTYKDRLKKLKLRGQAASTDIRGDMIEVSCLTSMIVE